MEYKAGQMKSVLKGLFFGVISVLCSQLVMATCALEGTVCGQQQDIKCSTCCVTPAINCTGTTGNKKCTCPACAPEGTVCGQQQDVKCSTCCTRPANNCTGTEGNQICTCPSESDSSESDD